MNTDYLEKIEAYLNNEMSPSDKKQFEADLTTDPELQSALQMYRTIDADMRGYEKYKLQNNALKSTLSNLNNKYFENEPQAVAKVVPLYSRNIFKILTAVAASAVLLLVTYFAFFRSTADVQYLANAYVKENLQHINQTVSVPEDTLQFGLAGRYTVKNPGLDSLEAGITAFNNQEFNSALRYFQGLLKTHPDDEAAKKYTGMVYLRTKAYDQALREFTELAHKQESSDNPGLFLQAVTLMLRNQPGDQHEAKQVLQQVVKTKAEGSQEAARWLEEF
ncbi:hypothetical protein HUW51_24140 [Adhaeribacter swui]|uniref:Uncharacterized protein n=1 Tax=Adhaeribacter swui TaxID=2086471 RepID=A0A7G7GER3_9BACT|nr:hypothetical protein [Adhaeribacter swui]QNF35647.1 hypothetical protein HUW51_24140 [Adhaeribacter swui]